MGFVYVFLFGVLPIEIIHSKANAYADVLEIPSFCSELTQPKQFRDILKRCSNNNWQAEIKGEATTNPDKLKVARYELTGDEPSAKETQRTKTLGACRAIYERINEFNFRVFQRKSFICNQANKARLEFSALPRSTTQNFLVQKQRDLLNTMHAAYETLAREIQDMWGVIEKYRRNNQAAEVEFQRLNTATPSSTYTGAAKEHSSAITEANNLKRDLETELAATQARSTEIDSQRAQFQNLNHGFGQPGSLITGAGNFPGNPSGLSGGNAIANALPWIQAGSAVGQLAMAMNNVAKVPNPPKPTLAGHVAGTDLARNDVTATSNTPKATDPVSPILTAGASNVEKDSNVSNSFPKETGSPKSFANGSFSSSPFVGNKSGEVKTPGSASIGKENSSGEPRGNDVGETRGAPTELGPLAGEAGGTPGAPKPTKISGSENDASIKNILKDMEHNFALGTLQDPSLAIPPMLPGLVDPNGIAPVAASEFPPEMEAGNNLMAARENRAIAAVDTNIFTRIHAYHLRCIKKGMVLKVPRNLPN